MAFVLAEHPVKHPNYPNGDHYAVLDTTDGVVEYITIKEIQDYISQGITFVGNHYLAIKDEKQILKGYISIVRENLTSKLVYYLNKNCVVVEFNETHNLVQKSYTAFKRNEIYDPLRETKHGGILGYASYSTIYKDIYTVWTSLLARAYTHESGGKSYSDTSLSKDWLYFPNFLNWYLSQCNYTQDIITILVQNSEELQLDKDILIKGNREYSSTACCLVPKQINNLIKHRTKSSYYPLGLDLHSNCIRATITKNNTPNNRCTCNFKTFESSSSVYYDIAKAYKNINKIPKEQWAAIGYCFLWYKEQKEAEINRLAEYWYNYEYEGQIYHCITKECYDALMNWVVDIND